MLFSQNSGPIPDNRSVANEAVYETALGTDDVQLPSKESVAETTEDENTREEIDVRHFFAIFNLFNNKQ